MKAPPVNVAEEEQKVLQKLSLQKRSTKSLQKSLQTKVRGKIYLKKYTPAKTRSPKKLNTDSKERSVT